jgi:microcystin-dependent protein
MKRMSRFLLALASLAALWLPARAAGTLPIALTQQFKFSGCSNTSAACGQPLNGGLLYFFQAGTVATRQDSFTDPSLTTTNPWPLPLDANGRVPPFYLADGSVHVRLTDSAGLVQFDYPSLLVVGASGGGGSGAVIDVTTIASVGDTKFRQAAATLSGWVRLNGLTIGSATSGASERANADTQALFVYLYGICDNTHCPVSGGRTGNALNDFNANKALTVPDWRGRGPWGLDDMGNVAAGTYSGVPFSGSDTATTAGGLAGENAHTLTTAEMPSHNHGVTDPGHSHTISSTAGTFGVVTGSGGASANPPSVQSTSTATTGITITNTGGGGAHNNMARIVLGVWFMKL